MILGVREGEGSRFLDDFASVTPTYRNFGRMGDEKGIEEAELLAAAQAIVREAMAPYENLLSDDEKAIIRYLLECDLLVDPQGRIDLRRSLGDPALEESGEVATTTAPSLDDEGEETG